MNKKPSLYSVWYYQAGWHCGNTLHFCLRYTEFESHLSYQLSWQVFMALFSPLKPSKSLPACHSQLSPHLIQYHHNMYSCHSIVTWSKYYATSQSFLLSVWVQCHRLCKCTGAGQLRLPLCTTWPNRAEISPGDAVPLHLYVYCMCRGLAKLQHAV